MIKLQEKAQGASAFSNPDDLVCKPLDITGTYGAESHATPRCAWSVVFDKLAKIRNLEDDWDGEGSEAPHPTLVDYAITIASHFKSKNEISPDRVLAGVNGTVFLEWQTQDEYREIEVLSSDEAEIRTLKTGDNLPQCRFILRSGA